VASADPVDNTDPVNSHPAVIDAAVNPNVTPPEPDPPEAATVIDPPNRRSSEPVTDTDACDAFATPVTDTEAGEKPDSDAVTVNSADSPSANPDTVTTPPDSDDTATGNDPEATPSISTVGVEPPESVTADADTLTDPE
jgi:hypothetical protein